jgi:hypothetical protein
MKATRALGLVAGLGLAVFGAGACGHTHAVDQGASAESGANQTPPHDEKQTSHPRGGGAPAPVATSAEGLLAPGGADQIRQKLKADGSLTEGASLETGLRRFQAAHDLPQTGMPDHETVAKMGLDPDKIFRKTDTK